MMTFVGKMNNYFDKSKELNIIMGELKMEYKRNDNSYFPRNEA